MSQPPPHERVSTRISTCPSSLSHPCTVPSCDSSLDGVPDLYIISQLRRFAGNYWNKPETADCTVVVPKNTVLDPDDSGPAHAVSPGQSESESSNDRSRRPKQQNVQQKMAFKLHQQYLSIQSTLLQSVFQDWQSVHVQSTFPNQVRDGSRTRSQPGPSLLPNSRLSASNRASPTNSDRTPHILPSSRPNHPIIYLPVPDPASIPHLMYYMYFGTFNHIEDSLQNGTLTWQAIVRNVEYLGMRVEIKAALGRYHRIWMKPTSTTPGPSEREAEDDSSESGESRDDSRFDIELPDGKNRKRV